MKVKLDENIGRRGQGLLQAAGHDVMTVRDQGLGGATDEKLFDVCAEEGRVLITLDRDFGKVTRFPPSTSAGIVVLELGSPATIRAMLDRLEAFLSVLKTETVTGALWIVEPGRVRIHLHDRNDR